MNKFEKGDRVRYLPDDMVGEVWDVYDEEDKTYQVLYPDIKEERIVHESDLEFADPKITLLGRLSRIAECFSTEENPIKAVTAEFADGHITAYRRLGEVKILSEKESFLHDLQKLLREFDAKIRFIADSYEPCIMVDKTLMVSDAQVINADNVMDFKKWE